MLLNLRPERTETINKLVRTSIGFLQKEEREPASERVAERLARLANSVAVASPSRCRGCEASSVRLLLIMRLALIGVIQCLFGCSLFEKPEVAKCEKQILLRLEKPDSYVMVQHDSLSLGDRWEVGIEFGYVDRLGNRIKHAWQICDYPLVDGKPDTSRFVNLKGSLDVRNDRPAT